MNPRTDLNAIIDTARRALERWPQYEQTHADLAHGDSDKLGVRGGDTCDPVYASTLHLEQWNETCIEIHEALGHLRAAERRMTGVVTHHPETARLVDAAVNAARCADPVCTANAVKDGYCFEHLGLDRRIGFDSGAA